MPSDVKRASKHSNDFAFTGIILMENVFLNSEPSRPALCPGLADPCLPWVIVRDIHVWCPLLVPVCVGAFVLIPACLIIFQVDESNGLLSANTLCLIANIHFLNKPRSEQILTHCDKLFKIKQYKLYQSIICTFPHNMIYTYMKQTSRYYCKFRCLFYKH